MIEQVQAKINRRRRIVMPEDFVKNPDETMPEFVRNYVTNYARNYGTNYPKGTFQCRRNAHRSLGDIYLITRNYYPDVKVGQVKAILISMLMDGQINAFFCGTIRRMTYYVDGINLNYRQGITEQSFQRRLDLMLNRRDEFGMVVADLS